MLSQSEYISQHASLNIQQVKSTLKLLDEGATIPFIARYRKEATGKLDELQIEQVFLMKQAFIDLEKRRKYILENMEGQGVLSAELREKISNSSTLLQLEDLFMPFKQKRKTRADKAREQGLEALAKRMMGQKERNLEEAALAYVKKDIKNVHEALQGARDIAAEWINENLRAREIVRSCFERQACISATLVKGARPEDVTKYQTYVGFEAPLKKCKSHQILALRRAEQEGVLKISLRPESTNVIERLERLFLRQDPGGHLSLALNDAYKRLIAPAIENEFAMLSRQKAEAEAALVFRENLRQLLLAAPLGEKQLLAIDPGFRSGCKWVCLDNHGELLEFGTIYPHPPQQKSNEAKKQMKALLEKYKFKAVAIGNGTAGRETEAWLSGVFDKQGPELYMVNESGASIYSASPLAREEFPALDLTVRGAISIGRRLLDPLAELVKIDPKSIGVGQYQYDVDQKMLKQSLDNEVINCVNKVGVDVNTSSPYLLAYVAGLGPQLAQNIVAYRKENGAFRNRQELLSVPRMGAKSFEQCAGFLRIKNGTNPLDNTSVHPESYGLVKKIAAIGELPLSALIANRAALESIDLSTMVTEDKGLDTLSDIVEELSKAGLDPRGEAKSFCFAAGISTLEDLKRGMKIPGMVSNITNFGAFVDVGVKQDGLVHVSQIADIFVANPADFLRLGQQVSVWVTEVDVPRKRLSLSMKQQLPPNNKTAADAL